MNALKDKQLRINRDRSGSNDLGRAFPRALAPFTIGGLGMTREIRVWMDDEACSGADIKLGAHKYASDPSTRFLCKSYFANVLGMTLITDFAQIDPVLYEIARNPDFIIVAHNASFERQMWRYKMVPLGYPDIEIPRWRCTMAKAMAYSLPPKLGALCSVLEVEHRKIDSEPFKKLFKLQDGEPWAYQQAPKLFDLMYEYNIQDTLACRDVDLALPDLPPDEQILWEENERMNDVGVMLDMPLVQRVLEFIEYHEHLNNEAFLKLTGIPSVTLRQPFGSWIVARGYYLPKTPKGKWDTSKDAIRKLLRAVPPGDVAATTAIKLFQAGVKTSLAKYYAMALRAGADGVLRDILMYHAGHTGRYGGRGVQLQNMTRPDEFNIDAAISAIWSMSYETFAWAYAEVA